MHILSGTNIKLNDLSDWILSNQTFFLYSVGVIPYSPRNAEVNLFGFVYPISVAISPTDKLPSRNNFSAICKR